MKFCQSTTIKRRLIVETRPVNSFSNCPITPLRISLRPSAARSSRWKKLAFKVEVAAKMPPGHGDGRRLTQVLINLVGNAIKFTDAGEVVITGGATDGTFHLSVRDTGPAFPLPIRPSCFKNFNRPTMRSRARRAAPAWASPYRSASLRCTGAKSGLSRSSARARRFHSHCPSSSTSKSTWNQTSQRLSAQTILLFPLEFAAVREAVVEAVVGRFCCRSDLKVLANSDSQSLAAFCVGGGDDGTSDRRSGPSVLRFSFR